MAALNLGLRFALELCALGALGYGGWQVDAALWLKAVMAVLLPLLGALVRGRWVTPRDARPLPDPLRLAPEVVVFGGATLALLFTGHPVLAASLALLAAANRAALAKLHTGAEPA